ncbi:MAG: HlyD family secretion protein [bacterium]
MERLLIYKTIILMLSGAVIVVLLIPFKIGYSVKTPGKIMPARQWVVARGPDGRLISTLLDYKRGVHESYSVAQFERGDAVQFSLQSFVAAGATIVQGDTVASIYSNDSERQYVELEGALLQAQATLETLLTGEKQSVVEEAVRSLEFAKKEADEQRKIFERLRGLHQNNLISKEEFEIAADQRELNDIKVMIAQARLNNVQSGAKTEEVELIKARIRALQQEIQTLRKRFEQFTLVSPLSGIAHQVFSGDTVLVVKDTTQLLLKMPIKWRQRKYVAANQTVRLRAPDMDNEPDGKLLKVDRSVHHLSGRPVLIATATIDGYHPELVPGLILHCSIACDPVKPREYLRRILMAILR